MKTQLAYRSIKLGAAIVLLLGAIALVYSGILGFSVTSTPIRELDVLASVKIASSFSDADTAYLRTSLQWLREYLPEWYAYVNDAKPFTLAMDEDLQTRGILSNAKCCYSRGAGTIAFGERLGQWNISDVALVEGMQAQQIQFLSVLVHEITHIRDLRDGRIGEVVNSNTCIQAERSANTKELEFARALTTVQIAGDVNAQANYHVSVDKHLHLTEDNVDGVSWKIACILFHSE